MYFGVGSGFSVLIRQFFTSFKVVSQNQSNEKCTLELVQDLVRSLHDSGDPCVVITPSGLVNNIYIQIERFVRGEQQCVLEFLSLLDLFTKRS